MKRLPREPRELCLAHMDEGGVIAALEVSLRLVVDFGFVQPLQLVADLSQQVFPPRNVRVGFDTQR